MKWIKIEDSLPPRGVLVWVKRTPNKIEKEPIYLANRTASPISYNPDASTNCYWYGIHISSINKEREAPDSVDSIKFPSNFSDVTVMEWAYLGHHPENDIFTKEELLEAFIAGDTESRRIGDEIDIDDFNKWLEEKNQSKNTK